MVTILRTVRLGTHCRARKHVESEEGTLPGKTIQSGPGESKGSEGIPARYSS